MKQLCMLAWVMTLSLTLFAQGTVIEVQGMAEYPREVDRYEVEFTISPMNYYGYDQRDKPAIDELKAEFFKRMKENGFDQGRFKPANKPKYYSSAQDDDFIVLQLETSSKDEVTKLVGIKRLNGVYVSGGQTFYKTIAKPQEVIAAALKDAEENAATIAGAMGKRVGEVISVTDQSRIYATQPESFYEGEEKGKYYLLAKFSTE